MQLRILVSCSSLLAAIACSPADSTGALLVASAASPIVSTRSATAEQGTIDSLLSAGYDLYPGVLDSASTLWSDALQRSRAIDDSVRIARVLTGLGQAARLSNDLATSRRLGEQALAMKLHLEMREDLFISFNALGLVAWDEQRLGDATDLFEDAAEAAVRTSDSVSLAKAIMNMGLVAKDRGAFSTARMQLEQGGSMAASHNDSRTAVRALNNLAALEITLGDPQKAISLLERVRVLAPAAADSITEVNAMGQLAMAYNALGQPQRAFALLDSAIVVARRRLLRQEEAENISLLAELFGDAGDHQHALESYKRAIQAIDTTLQPNEHGTLLRNIGRSYAALGDRSRALQHVSKARTMHRQSELAYSEFADLLLLARLLQQDGKSADAGEALRDASALARAIDVPAVSAFFAITNAAVSLDAGAPQRALSALEQASGSLTLAGTAAVAEALHLEARAHAAMGNSSAAIQSGRRAIETLERVRANYASGELRTSFTSGHAELFESQTLLLMQAGKYEEAFAVADAARGRALIDHLSTARDDAATATDATQLIEQEQLLRRIGVLAAQRSLQSPASMVRSAGTPSIRSELDSSLVAAQRDYALIAARTGANRRLPIAAPALRASLPELQASLRRDEVLLEYFVTSERLLIFAVSRNGLTTFEVDETSEALSRRVRLVRDLLEQRNMATRTPAVLNELHRTLIAPVARTGALKNATRLIIVPHGALTYLPFSALLDSASKRYLVEDYALLRLPTSASLPVLRSTGGSSIASMTQVRTEVFAPLPDSLPGTRIEANSIRKIRPDASTHFGPSATESGMRAALARPAIVHVASHASMNSHNPLFSHLRLSGSSTKQGARPALHSDGRLEVHELLTLRVSSPLVFLSGCDTGLGQSWATQFDTGEDYTTIAQTFLYAGARNVIATLWRVDDAGSADLAVRFYKALGSADVVDALARAQRAMQKDPRFSEPYFWAAYDIMGAGDLGATGRKSVDAIR